MSVGKNIRKFLGKPFPKTEKRSDYLRNLTLISIFVALFLYVFQPFGISQIESGKALKCLGFGLMTLVGTLAFQLIYSLVLSRWKATPFTFGHWVLYMTGIMLTISLCNFLYARLLFFGDIRWQFFPDMLYGTFMVGFFPMVMLGALAMVRQESKNLAVAREINKAQPQAVPVQQKAATTLFGIPTDQIRYIEALQNYIRIGHVNAAMELVERTERATLKHVLTKAGDNNIVRCHRSFLVNRSAILTAEGNAQGLLLTLQDCAKVIPVSRSYVHVFRIG